jgi:hypothetical protein
MASGPYYAEGDYTATITSHTFTPGQYGVQLVIGIEPHVEGNAYPRTIYLPFLDVDGNPDKNIERTIAALAEIGYHDAPSRLDAGSENPVSLIGNEIGARCNYNKDGRERWYIKTEREPLAAVDKPTLRRLDALFGKQLRAAKTKDGPPSAKNPPAVDPNAELQNAANDESPF